MKPGTDTVSVRQLSYACFYQDQQLVVMGCSQAHPMAKTHHYGSRISQRGIRETTVELALRHGTQHGEKFVLGKKQIKNLMGEFDQIRKNLCTALDKGGVVVVASDGVLITAYDFDSRKGNY